MNFSGLFATNLGEKLWARITDEKTVHDMEVATKLRRPAVEAIGDDLIAEFGAPVRENRVKQMIGHMARQVMEKRGYVLDVQRVPVRFSKLFSTASRYKRP